MDGSIDVVGHTISAGGGAALTMIVNRVLSYFGEQKKRAEEIALAERLTRIETKLDGLLAAREAARKARK